MKFLRRNANRTLLNNYRAITILPTIYTSWGTVISNRLAPFWDLLRTEHRRAYENHKSTICIIIEIKQKFINNKIQGGAIRILSKAPDRIRRNMIWRFLKKKGIPCNLLKIIILWRDDTRLCVRNSRQLGSFVENNTGVSQGRHHSANFSLLTPSAQLNSP